MRSRTRAELVQILNAYILPYISAPTTPLLLTPKSEIFSTPASPVGVDDVLVVPVVRFVRKAFWPSYWKRNIDVVSGVPNFGCALASNLKYEPIAISINLSGAVGETCAPNIAFELVAESENVQSIVEAGTTTAC